MGWGITKAYTKQEKIKRIWVGLEAKQDAKNKKVLKTKYYSTSSWGV